MSWKNLAYWKKGEIIGFAAFMTIILNIFLASYRNTLEPSSFIYTLLSTLESVISLTVGLPILITKLVICFGSCTSGQSYTILFI
jgi:hypothetical protein